MRGLDHYSRFVDVLLQAGIRPWCTMYHWDLPQALEDRGGWPNRDLANYFADYAGILATHLGDRVTVWAPFNMSWAIAFMGYVAGARWGARMRWRLPVQWAEGYTERYGLIYTDFRNQKRTIKDSGLWYGRVDSSDRLDV